MYLRRVAEQELSLEQLYEKVKRLGGECRCKACFECLEQAGCPTRY